MDAIKGLLDEQNKFAKLALEEGTVQLPKTPAGQKEFEASEGQFSGNAAFNLDEFKAAVNQYAKTGVMKALKFAVTTGTASGAYLPKEILAPVTVRRLQNAYRGLLAAYGLSPIETDISAFSLPVQDDTANFGANASETAAAVELDPDDTGAIPFTPKLWTSKQFWYSNTMIMSQSFDVFSYTLPNAQKRIEKQQEVAWTTTMKAKTVASTTAAPTAVTYADLLNWEHSLAAAYRSDAGFIISDSLYKALRGLVDTNNRPIMDLDPTNVFAGKIHGRPVLVCDAFDAITAALKPGVFASADALKVVDMGAPRIIRYANVPSKSDQVGLELVANGDFGAVSAGVALLQMHV